MVNDVRRKKAAEKLHQKQKSWSKREAHHTERAGEERVCLTSVLGELPLRKLTSDCDSGPPSMRSLFSTGCYLPGYGKRVSELWL